MLVVRRRAGRAVLALTAVSALAAGGCARAPGQNPAGAARCTRATAAAPRLRLPQPADVVGSLPSQPYAVAATGRWAFASSPTAGPVQGYGLISVIRLRARAARLARTVRVLGEPLGLTLAGAGRYLLVANYSGWLSVLSVPALESGRGRLVVATLPSRGLGPVEVGVAAGGQFAFVPEEASGDVAVFRLGRLLAGGAAGIDDQETGLVPVAAFPSGIAMSPDGARIYVISQGAAQAAQGRLTAISVARAERDPARAVVGSVAAGCDPVRVTLSPGGTVAWVTDRGGNALTAFRLSARSGSGIGRLAAVVRVGSEPVDARLIDGGSTVLVTDSARFTHPYAPQTVAVVSAARALARRPALLGYLPAGAFPRQFGQAPGGPLLWTDFDSKDVRVISRADLAWLGRLRR